MLTSMIGITNENRAEWIARYAKSHQHPINRICHTYGIPMVAGSLVLLLASIGVRSLLMPALALFVVGWVFQFVGHAFERKVPEFFHDWRFLLIGLSWWWSKVNGRA